MTSSRNALRRPTGSRVAKAPDVSVLARLRRTRPLPEHPFDDDSWTPTILTIRGHPRSCVTASLHQSPRGADRMKGGRATVSTRIKKEDRRSGVGRAALRDPMKQASDTCRSCSQSNTVCWMSSCPGASSSRPRYWRLDFACSATTHGYAGRSSAIFWVSERRWPCRRLRARSESMARSRGNHPRDQAPENAISTRLLRLP